MGDFAVLLIVLLVVVVVWRGPKTLPEIGRMLGRGVKATKDEVRSISDDRDRQGPTGGAGPAA